MGVWLFEVPCFSIFRLSSVYSQHLNLIKGGEQQWFLALKAQEMYFISFGVKISLTKTSGSFMITSQTQQLNLRINSNLTNAIWVTRPTYKKELPVTIFKKQLHFMALYSKQELHHHFPYLLFPEDIYTANNGRVMQLLTQEDQITRRL